MDALIEILLEFIFEVFGEVIFTAIGAFFDKAETDRETLKKTKIVIYSILAAGLITLLTISLIYKKGIMSIVVVSYLFLVTLVYYLRFFFKEIVVRPRVIPYIVWPLRILKYVFMASLIVMANIFLTDPTAKGWLIAGAIIGIVIYVCIDIFRIRRNSHR